VTLSAYWLDRVEVSVGAYRRCAELGRCAPLPYRDGGRRLDRAELPASLVRWEDAQAYCRSVAPASRPRRSSSGPPAAPAPRFPWGNAFHRPRRQPRRFGWDRSELADGYAELAPVGSFPAGRTPEGFLDLAGNVAEWVSDLFSTPYPATPVTDPQGPPHAFASGATPLRVLRGGSYELPAPFLRGAARMPQDGATRAPTIGFRCARSATATGVTRP
jgi:formylglycine-generating enzyme required for sulfatase activity